MVVVGGGGGGDGAGADVLFLEHGDFGFEESVLAAEFGDFRGGGEGAGDALRLDRRFESVEFLDAGFECEFEVLVFLPEVALDAAYP